MNPEPIPPDEALRRLLDGNRRFLYANASHPNQSSVHRLTLANAQRPFAVVLGCADSRVPPEIIFDQGFGDLFTIRVAGNIVSDEVLGSVEYALEHLGTRLVVVLGHQSCGAVRVALEDGEAPGHIESLVRAIRPAVALARQSHGDLLDSAVIANIRRSVEQLRQAEPLLAARVRKGEVDVVGMRYALTTGALDMLELS